MAAAGWARRCPSRSTARWCAPRSPIRSSMTRKGAARMSEVQFESALQSRDAPKGLAVQIREITSRGMIDLRGDASDSKFASAVKEVLGLDLPTAPRTSMAWGDNHALWLSPDQWLILCPRAKTVELLASLRSALAGVHSFAVDVSDMRTIIR